MGTEETERALIDLRSDPKKTALRYDEIISLRMFLLDIQDELSRSEDPAALKVRKDISERAKQWGKREDFV